MKIAVSINRARLNTTGKEGSGRLTRLKIVNLQTIISLKRNPFNKVLISHRVLNFANSHMNNMTIALQVDRRNMLLNRSINRICLYKRITSRNSSVISKCNHEIRSIVSLIKFSHWNLLN